MEKSENNDFIAYFDKLNKKPKIIININIDELDEKFYKKIDDYQLFAPNNFHGTFKEDYSPVNEIINKKWKFDRKY